MGKYYLIFANLTFTYKAKYVLKFRYPNLKIIPTPKDLSTSGCRYAILINGNADKILQTLKNSNIPILDVIKV